MPKKLGLIDVGIGVDGVGTIVGLSKKHEWFRDPAEAVHRRERIQIHTPEGKCLFSYIQDIQMMYTGDGHSGACFILPDPTLAIQIPRGSELWLERDEGADPVIEP